jgi:hypothetical protein
MSSVENSLKKYCTYNHSHTKIVGEKGCLKNGVQDVIILRLPAAVRRPPKFQW